MQTDPNEAEKNLEKANAQVVKMQEALNIAIQSAEETQSQSSESSTSATKPQSEQE